MENESEKKKKAEEEIKAKEELKKKADEQTARIVKEFLDGKLMIVRSNLNNKVFQYLKTRPWQEVNQLIAGMIQDDEQPINKIK